MKQSLDPAQPIPMLAVSISDEAKYWAFTYNANNKIFTGFQQKDLNIS